MKIICKGFVYVNSKIRKNLALFIIVLILSVINTSLSLIGALVNQQTIDVVFYKSNIEYLFNTMIFLIIGIYLCSLSLGVLQSYIKAKYHYIITTKLQSDFYQDILYSSTMFHKSVGGSEIYYRMFKDIPIVCEYILSIYFEVPITLLYFLGTLFIMFNWSLHITVVFLIMFILQVAIVIFFQKPIQHVVDKQRKVEQNLVGKINEDFRNVFHIKLLAAEKIKKRFLDKYLINYIQTNTKNRFVLLVFGTVSTFIKQVWTILLLIIGALAVHKQTLTVGEYIAFSNISISATQSMLSILDKILRLNEIKISAQRYFEYINHKDKKEYGGNKLFSFKHELLIDTIFFKYPLSEEKLLCINDILLKPQSIVAITGGNGLGKSTLLQILGRLLISNDIYVYIDDINIYDISYDDYRQNIAVLLQNPILFPVSIKDNITTFNNDYTTSDIENSHGAPLITDIVKEYGYSKNIEGSDIHLSEGEKQRISICRLLLKKPRILFLDEPTSFLDTKSKQLFYDILRKYVVEEQALIVMVSHNKEDLNICDIVLELREKKLFYSKL